MEIIFSGSKKFEFLWNRFEWTSKNISWQYLYRWKEYLDAYCEKTVLQDLSFIVSENDNPLALTPLYIEMCGKYAQISIADYYHPSPLLHSDLDSGYKKKVERICFEKIDELAEENRVVKAMASLNPLSENYTHNLLQEYRYLDSSLCTSIIDLSLDRKKLWQNLRTSYKPIINRGKNEFAVRVVDFKNSDIGVMQKYQALHRRASGRATRPEKTFHLQTQMVEEDNAVLIGAEVDKVCVGFCYFIHCRKNVFYASAVNDPDYMPPAPLGHFLLWTAVEYYKSRGFRRLDLGCQQFGPQLFDHPTPKEVQISFFKRGFGGKLVPFFRGIKYYDKESMGQDLRRNMNILLDQYN